MDDDEIREHRRRLPKGHIRESNTAHSVGYDTDVEVEGDTATLQTPAPRSITEAAVPREVAEDIYGMIWNWARGSRENFALMAQVVRKSNPDSFGHLSDDELATKIEQHAKDAARKATEDTYKKNNKWDVGNNLDMWEGKPA